MRFWDDVHPLFISRDITAPISGNSFGEGWR